MGKGAKVINTIFNVATKPLFDQMRKETRELDKRYDKYCNDIDKMIVANDRNWEHRTFEVHQPYDSIIHENDFW